MANRYWVGGSGTWDNVTTTNWSLTSGGANGASPPTSADYAYFDTNSGTGTVNIASNAVCITCILGAPNLTLVLIANHTVTFSALTITDGTFNCSTFNMSFGSGIVTVTGGSFICNGGTITAGSLSSTSGTCAITLNNSTLNLAGSTPIYFSTAGLTFSAGTSTINCSNATPTLSSSHAFWNVNFTSTSLNSISITGTNSFNNLTFASKASAGITPIALGGSQTIAGSLTIPAPTTIASSRYFIRSNGIGVIRDISASSVSLTDVDFRDINNPGTAWTGTRLGDCGGNTNITFPAPKNVYWNNTSANWNTTLSWALTPNGTVSNLNFPLPQDIVNFTDNTGFSSGTCTINANYNIGSINFSARTLPMTLNTIAAPNIYGDITLVSNITLTGAITLTLAGRNKTQTITSAGKTFPQPITQSTIDGSVVFADAFIISNTYTLAIGTLSTNYNITCNSFYSSSGSQRTISLGSGQLYCVAATSIYNTTIGTGLTIIGTPTVVSTYTGASAVTISPGSKGNVVNFRFPSGTYALTITANSSVNSLDLTGFSGSIANTAFSIYGDLTLPSSATVTSGTGAITFAGTSGTQTIITNGITIDRPAVFNGIGGTFQLGGALTLGATNGSITHTNGTFNLNGYSVICLSYNTSAGTKVLNFGNGGILNISGGNTSFNNGDSTGFTSSATFPGTINMYSASPKTFAGGGATYVAILSPSSTGSLSITGANTFTGISNNSQPITIIFPEQTTTTIQTTTFCNGTLGNLVTLQSSSLGTQATLSLASGTVNAHYLNIKGINATGGATWYALPDNGNVNSGNNSGWLWATITIIASAFFLFFR